MRIFLTILLFIAGSGTAFSQAAAPSASPGDAQEAPQLDLRDASEVVPQEFIWLNRLVVVFADSPNDPVFQEQLELLKEQPGDLLERDVIVVTDTAPGTPSPLREMLRPHGFGLVLIDKDGKVKLRKPVPWDVRELSRSIDKTELRQQELREERSQRNATVTR
jgi:hypothetical protein